MDVDPYDDTRTSTDGEPDVAGTRLAAGATIGRYQVRGVLGAGGMGVVYRAFDPELGRELAIKVVTPGTTSGKAQDRLLDEARAMAKLRHAHIVPVFDVGSTAAGVYIVMPLYSGGTLHDWLHGQRRPWREVVERFVAAGQGLAAAHAAGLIHRDFKPKNVFLGDAGEPLVGDFGLAAPTASLPGDPTTSGTATTSTIAGTPAYMAPEQAQGAVLDARADQYAYCISFWEGLCGQRPTEAETRTEGPLAFARPLLDGRERGAPAWLLTAVARGFAAMPERRWPSIDALLTHIARRRRRRTRVAIGGGATLALAATAALFMTQRGQAAAPDPCAPPTARLAAIWNPARRAQLAATLVAKDPAQGAAMGARVTTAFDQLANDWSLGHVEACRATRVDGRQSDELLDRRMACLDEAYAGFAESVQAFEVVTSPAALDATIKVLDGLPDLPACADTSKYADQPPPPTDPDARREYTELRAEAAAIDVVRLAGNLKDHRTRSDAAVTRARALGHPVVLAKLLDQLAAARHNAREFEDDVRLLREVVTTAAAARDDRLAAGAWTDIVRITAIDLERPSEAEAMLLSAEAAVARAGNLPRYSYDLLSSRSSIAVSRGDYEAALRLMDEGIRLLRSDEARARDPFLSNRLFMATGDRALILTKMRRSREAIEGFEATIAMVIKTYGPVSPFLVPYYGNLSQAYYNAGAHAKAIESAQRGAAIAEARMEPSPMLALTVYGVATLLVENQRFSEARPYLERALALARATLRADHPFIADIVGDQGVTLAGLGRREDGRALIVEALGIYEKNARPSINWGLTLHALGDVEAAAKRWPEAIAAYEHARGMLEDLMGKKAAYVVAARLGPAVVHARQGRWPRTLAITSAVLADPFDEEAANIIPQVRFWHGAALVELGRDRGGGLAEAVAARATLVAGDAIKPLALAEIDAWLVAHGVTIEPARTMLGDATQGPTATSQE